MNFKTLLLGSAAAMMVAGAAQAADLTVAEPVDYVKVCDAFGAGFYYSPGTDTCIKVGGYVKFGTNANNGLTDADAKWGSFYTEASIQLTASSVTEYGNLTGWIDLRTRTGSGYEYAANGDADGHIDSAYLQLGGLKAGHFTSAFDYLGGYTDYGSFRADQSTDHIEYTYALGSFGLIGSIEDGSDRLTLADTSDPTPDLVAALTYASGPINAKLSGAYVQNETFDGDQSGYAVQLGVEVALDQIGKGDKLGLQAVYGKDAPAYTGWQKFFGNDSANFDGSIYGGFVSYQHYWNPGLWSAIAASYLHNEGGDVSPSGDLWQITASTDWAIVKNLDLMLDGSYAKVKESNAVYAAENSETAYGDNQWSFNVWLKRSW